jgi:hypothetical protein
MDTEPIIVCHRLYYDGFEDYRCKYMPRHCSEVLKFVLYQGNWVLIDYDDWCTTDDIPQMVERFNGLTGQDGRTIIYSFHHKSSLVREAEEYARSGNISRFPILDLKPIE